MPLREAFFAPSQIHQRSALLHARAAGHDSAVQLFADTSLY
jgi:hypothetical protein